VLDVRGEDEWLPPFQFTRVAASRAVTGARFVRLTVRSPQVPDLATNCPDGAFDGCVFMAFTEMEVFGRAR
jgi:extracellular elastinolytic metalloproteinase